VKPSLKISKKKKGDSVGCQLKEEQQHETVNLEKMKKDLNIVRNGLQVRSFNRIVTQDFSGPFVEQGMAYSSPLVLKKILEVSSIFI
jgi:hypothetical protein